MRELFHRVTSLSLRTKLFFSYLWVPLVGSLIFMAAVSFVTPVLFSYQMGGVWESLRGAFGAPVFYSLLVGGLAAAMVAAATSLIVAARITTPIRLMLKATRRISAGHYGERVPVRANDELGALSENFNAMAAALEEDERHRREFIADVSHELRTPVATLQTYLEGLTDGVVEPCEETWALLYAETERMRRLVDDLQQLSRAETGQLALRIERVSAADVTSMAKESMFALFAEKGVELEDAVPEGLPQVAADEDRTVQILTNVLSNALRHTPAGGRVVVGAEARGKKVMFRVSDTGMGIAAEHLPHVFERFYRSDKSRSRESGGSGLGLAICRALVEAMGGEIRAESAGVGKGTTFVFTLPVVSPKS